MLATERYLLDEMTQLERHVFEDHYFGCEICAEDIRVARLMKEGVRGGLLGTSRQSRWRPIEVLPWAAAATLALVVGYQTLGPTKVPGAGGEFAAQAVAPITLRPATRGQLPRVNPGAAGEAVVLAVDVARGTGELEYDLRAPSGNSLASGRVPGPAAGAPLFLLVPSRILTAAGDYTLVVRNATDRADSSSEQFQFSVNAAVTDKR